MNITLVPLTMISGIMVARTLGPAGKGTLALIILIAMILKMLGGLGMEFANVYYISKNKNKVHIILSNNVFLWSLSVIAITGIVILTKDFIINSFLPQFNPIFFNFGLIIFPFMLWLGFSLTIFQGLEKFKEFNILKISEPISRVIFLLLLMVFFKMGITGAASALSLAYIVAALLSIMLMRRYVKSRLAVNRNLFAKSIKYGVKGQIGIFFQFFNYRLDMFIINSFLNISAVGFYSVSVAIAELLWHVPNSIALTLFPRISTKAKESANEFTCRISRNSISIMLIIAPILTLASIFIIPLFYGDSFKASIGPLHILLPGVVCFGLVKILTAHLHGQGKPHYGSIATICSLIFTIGFDFLLIPRMGITGAALATTIAYSFSLIVTLIFFVRESQLQLKDFLTPSFEFFSVIHKRFFDGKING